MWVVGNSILEPGWLYRNLRLRLRVRVLVRGVRVALPPQTMGIGVRIALQWEVKVVDSLACSTVEGPL